MKFSTGDLVVLKNTGEEGRITAVLNRDMVEVEVSGVVFPVFADEVDHPYLKWFQEKNRKQAKGRLPLDPVSLPVQKQPVQYNRGFHFSFLPEFKLDVFDEIVDKLRVYFVNESPYQLQLSYECVGKQLCLFRHTAQVQPFSHFYLHDVPYDLMHDQPKFVWNLRQQENTLRQASMADTLRIKPKRLFEHILDLQKENKPMFTIGIADDFPEISNEHVPRPVLTTKSFAALKQKETRTDADNIPLYEVDLHIDQLVKDQRGMTSFDMMKIQLTTFEKALDRAVRLHQHSMVVIHGVGKGRLKEEIHFILKGHPHVSHFVNNWNPKYGIGATEMFFK